MDLALMPRQRPGTMAKLGFESVPSFIKILDFLRRGWGMLHVKSEDIIAKLNLEAERLIAEIDGKYLDNTEAETTHVNHDKDPDIGAIVNWYGPFTDRAKAINCAKECGVWTPNNGLCLVTGVKRRKRPRDLFASRKPKLQYIHQYLLWR